MIKRLINRDTLEKVLSEHFNPKLLTEIMAVIDNKVPDEAFEAPRDINVIGEELNYLEMINKALTRQVKANEYQMARLNKEFEKSLKAMIKEEV